MDTTTVTPADWVAALKSGKYKQAQATFVAFGAGAYEAGDKPDRHCCLAVLADICGLPVDGQSDGFWPITDELDEDGGLVTHPMPAWLTDPDRGEFARWNDDSPSGYPIEQIEEYFNLKEQA